MTQPSRFRELLEIARSWDNFNFKEYREYLVAKAKWKKKKEEQRLMLLN
jgi:hypothetical protein